MQSNSIHGISPTTDFMDFMKCGNTNNVSDSLVEGLEIPMTFANDSITTLELKAVVHRPHGIPFQHVSMPRSHNHSESNDQLVNQGENHLGRTVDDVCCMSPTWIIISVARRKFNKCFLGA